MEDSATVASLEDGPDSWEVADVEASVRRLLLSSEKDSGVSCDTQDERDKGSGSCFDSKLGLKSGLDEPDDLINKVDQFLREAIQNPRDRLSVLRMEQEVERFIHDPTREQMEFRQLPTSYLRLAAHRVAQHYSLQSMVLLNNNLPDGCGSKIVVWKTSDIRLPLIRLADIPVNLPTVERGAAVKVSIKQRPQKGSLGCNTNSSTSNTHSGKSNSSKSVEERKEEYDKARARIFSSDSSSGKPVSDPWNQDSHQHGSMKIPKTEETSFSEAGSEMTIGRSLSDTPTSSSRLPKSCTEKEPIGRPKTNNRVAIFRDCEVDRTDPDYDRSYDRYVQRFDPGFGFTGGAYAIQPMFVPTVNYNTEFPQLVSSHRLPEPQPHSLPQHHPGPWISTSTPAGICYGTAEAMLSPFTSGHVNACSNSGLYLHSPFPCQRAGLPYIHPLEQIHQPFSQPHQQQPDACFGLARPW